LLQGVRVLEFGQQIAGPLTGMLLADLGADVVRVERPRRARRRHPVWYTYNRNKRVVSLDLASEIGRAEAMRLLEGCDVVVDGLKRGDLARYGIDPVAAQARRPDLIHCEVTGFAPETGVSAHPWEGIVSAAAGLFLPNLPSARQRSPSFTSLPVASTFAGLLAANAIVAALVCRRRSGWGQRIEVPLHSALVYAFGFKLLRTNWTEDSVLPSRPRRPNPLVHAYQCSDGRWIQVHVSRPRFLRAFVEELGLQSWRDEGLIDRDRLVGGAAARAEAVSRLQELFATQPAEYWEERLSRAGVSCAVCRSAAEWLRHPHALQSGLTVELATDRGLLRQPGPLLDNHAPTERPLAPIQCDSRDVNWQPRRPPQRGPRPSAALEGVRVLDLGQVLAGPAAGRVLAEFGAQVIKVDPPGVAVNEAFWLDTNRGKRSVLLDLKAPAGREAFDKLAQDADVLIENFRLGVTERLGIDHETLKRLNPRLVYSSVNCYGYAGPFAARPGWEQVAQAATGIQARNGGRGRRPRLARFAVLDYATGLAASLGALAALYKREATGRGRRVTTSLVASAGLLQASLIAEAPTVRRRDFEGPEAQGPSLLSRIYATADGWVYLHCPWLEASSLSEAPELRHLAGRLAACKRRADPDLEQALEEAFLGRPSSYWESALNRGRVAVLGLAGSWDLLAQPGLRRARLIETHDDPVWGKVEHVGIPHRLALTPAVSGARVPLPGADTRRVLLAHGVSARAYDRLRRSGAAQGSRTAAN
jgi:crotonobetainyl-CoA:carnitine CoA-transferase CaiB-like acyl-CoA transferase